MRSTYRTRGGGSRWMTLNRAGTCKVCKGAVAQGDRAYWDAIARTVTCGEMACAKADGLTAKKWVGSPISGTWVESLSEVRCGPGVVTEPDLFARTRSRGYYGRDAGRCEDSPACGCCS